MLLTSQYYRLIFVKLSFNELRVTLADIDGGVGGKAGKYATVIISNEPQNNASTKIKNILLTHC